MKRTVTLAYDLDSEATDHNAWTELRNLLEQQYFFAYDYFPDTTFMIKSDTEEIKDMFVEIADLFTSYISQVRENGINIKLSQAILIYQNQLYYWQSNNTWHHVIL